MPTPRRILIVSASIGGGHAAAGRALEAACRARGLETVHVDMLDYTTAPFRRLYRQAYFDLVRTAPEMIDWLGRRMDRQPSVESGRYGRLRARLVRVVSYHLPRLVDRHRPDVLLHTHFLPPDILASRGRRRGVPQAVVVTDFVAHALWISPGVARYFVGADEVAVHLHAAGVPPERVRVTGIPIDPAFASLPERAAARHALGLEPDRDLLLVMAGGMDPRPLLELVRQLRTLRWPATAWIVCGRSEGLLGAVRGAVADAEGPVSFRVTGFTKEIPLLMAAADLAVGKPGGLTTSEALAAGVPFAVVDPYPLQEEGNANHLLELGAAIRIEPLTTFTHKIRTHLASPERRAARRAAALSGARPHAARDVIASLVDEPLAPAGSA